MEKYWGTGTRSACGKKSLTRTLSKGQSWGLHRGAWQEDERQHTERSSNGRFRLDGRKIFFTVRTGRQQTRLPREVLESTGTAALVAIPKAAICTAWVPEEAEASSCWLKTYFQSQNCPPRSNIWKSYDVNFTCLLSSPNATQLVDITYIFKL